MNETPGSIVVLFVDPDAEVRTRRVATLTSRGVTVLEAEDAETGVIVAQTLKRLDVLVSEGYLKEGGYTGFDLRDAVKQKFPQVRTIFTSRYELTGYEQYFEGCPLMVEPVNESQLFSEVLGLRESGAAKPATAVPKAVMSAPVAVAVAVPDDGVAKAVLVEDDEENQPHSLAPKTDLGNYTVTEHLYAERDAETYLAIQRGVNREVVLVLLRPDRVNQPGALDAFHERERVKASIAHPRIAPLYEALEVGGRHFYTREMPNGRSVEELQEAGTKFKEKQLVDIIANVAEAMGHATGRGHHYRMLSPRDVFVDDEGQASIVNVFRPPGDKPRDFQADTKKFLIMLRLLADGPRARHLIDDLVRESHTWENLSSRAKELQEEFHERSLLKRADTKEAHDIKAAHERLSVPVWVLGLSAVVVVGLVTGIVLRNRSVPPPPPKPLQVEMVAIPAGEFTYQQETEKRVNNAFWIDKYEVTIGQYEEFLDALAKDPAKAKAYDHADQPAAKKDHLPDKWSDYLDAARTAGYFNNQPVNINCPIANIDWWDAWAYAKWRGHRLPTEEEWERAARGREGRVHPWGNDDKPKAANLGADYEPKGKGGTVDGFNFWAPEDKMPDDVSEDGAIGLAGNVEEWTATHANHPDYPDLPVPVVRGGHFALNRPANVLTIRTFADSPENATIARGFRTVSDTPPPATATAAESSR
ncbi:SUMF1/EgtB/PvdO family nonheme iron enzyme [Roseimicrobium gellanilyticum]|uniref:SUMF1/EgtB/PvdO family nonheme iron enzyme n=1 Tax=Roseimicrobium gellanilyticum TaxID=748857 RepID=UPI0011BD4485|nr:SUMF1/EgtB/PvdO family nonheme iron enzyme [Roseimicrobium gellanilyticum]